MNRAVERRLEAIERRVALLRPPPGDPLAWLAWTENDELDCLEQIARRMADDCLEPSVTEQLRWLEIEAAATRRMLAGEPDDIERPQP